MCTDEAGAFGFHPVEKVGNGAKLTALHGHPAEVLALI